MMLFSDTDSDERLRVGGVAKPISPDAVLAVDDATSSDTSTGSTLKDTTTAAGTAHPPTHTPCGQHATGGALFITSPAQASWCSTVEDTPLAHEGQTPASPSTLSPLRKPHGARDGDGDGVVATPPRGGCVAATAAGDPMDHDTVAPLHVESASSSSTTTEISESSAPAAELQSPQSHLAARGARPLDSVDACVMHSSDPGTLSPDSSSAAPSPQAMGVAPYNPLPSSRAQLHAHANVSAMESVKSPVGILVSASRRTPARGDDTLVVSTLSPGTAASPDKHLYASPTALFSGDDDDAGSRRAHDGSTSGQVRDLSTNDGVTPRSSPPCVPADGDVDPADMQAEADKSPPPVQRVISNGSPARPPLSPPVNDIPPMRTVHVHSQVVTSGGLGGPSLSPALSGEAGSDAPARSLASVVLPVSSFGERHGSLSPAASTSGGQTPPAPAMVRTVSVGHPPPADRRTLRRFNSKEPQLRQSPPLTRVDSIPTSPALRRNSGESSLFERNHSSNFGLASVGSVQLEIAETAGFDEVKCAPPVSPSPLVGGPGGFGAALQQQQAADNSNGPAAKVPTIPPVAPPRSQSQTSGEDARGGAGSEDARGRGGADSNEDGQSMGTRGGSLMQAMTASVGMSGTVDLSDMVSRTVVCDDENNTCSPMSSPERTAQQPGGDVSPLGSPVRTFRVSSTALPALPPSGADDKDNARVLIAADKLSAASPNPPLMPALTSPAGYVHAAERDVRDIGFDTPPPAAAPSPLVATLRDPSAPAAGMLIARDPPVCVAPLTAVQRASPVGPPPRGAGLPPHSPPLLEDAASSTRFSPRRDSGGTGDDDTNASGRCSPHALSPPRALVSKNLLPPCSPPRRDDGVSPLDDGSLRSLGSPGRYMLKTFSPMFDGVCPASPSTVYDFASSSGSPRHREPDAAYSLGDADDADANAAESPPAEHPAVAHAIAVAAHVGEEAAARYEVLAGECAARMAVVGACHAKAADVERRLADRALKELIDVKTRVAVWLGSHGSPVGADTLALVPESPDAEETRAVPRLLPAAQRDAK